MLRFYTAVFLFLLTSAVLAKPAIFSTSDGAIRGYDPVAYFEVDKPVKGQSQWSHEWNGATWYFSSQENLAKFKQKPEEYAPQFGGYCAYGVSQGYKVSIDPKAWTVLGGKLYLNYSKSVQRDWLESPEEYIKQARQNWKDLQ